MGLFGGIAINLGAEADKRGYADSCGIGFAVTRGQRDKIAKDTWAGVKRESRPFPDVKFFIFICPRLLMRGVKTQPLAA